MVHSPWWQRTRPKPRGDVRSRQGSLLSSASPSSRSAAMCRSITIDLDDSCGEGLRGFLRQVVPNTTLDDPVCIPARELVAVSRCVRVWRAVGVTFEGDRWYGDHRTFGKPPFQIVVS